MSGLQKPTLGSVFDGNIMRAISDPSSGLVRVNGLSLSEMELVLVFWLQRRRCVHPCRNSE